MASLNIDGVQLSDLSVGGWAALGLAGVTLGYGVVSAVSGDFGMLAATGFLAALFGFMAYEGARPEYDTVCDSCGDHIHVQSSRDGVSECVHVRTTGAPRRISYGPLSAVLSRRKREFVYCTAACADADNRVVIGAHGRATDANATGYEVSD